MTQTLLNFDDPTRRKHGGNPRSVRAFDRVSHGLTAMEDRIRIYIAACGQDGATCKEVAEKFGKFPHQISGRFTTLNHKKHVIFEKGTERDHYAVYVTDKRWVVEG
jgi:hypothetical protein